MSSSPLFRLSNGVRKAIAPPIPRAYEWAARYQPTPGRPLLDMSQGVPGIPPPQILRDAIADASRAPESFGYTRWDGEPALRAALAQEMQASYGSSADITPEDVALTAGCNLAFTAVAMTIADAGDEIILPVPWYFNHQMDLDLLGIKTVGLTTSPSDGFLPSVEKCKSLITSKTKAIALVSPNNPTGAVYPPALLTAFSDLAASSGIALIVDETYRDFITSGPPHSLFTNPSWRRTLIQLYSFSKSYCMPGHRLGAIIASPQLLASTRTVLDCLQICAPRPAQIALGTHLAALRPFVRDNARAIEARHRLFKELLPAGWTIGAQGGYFAFMRHPFPGVSSETLCEDLAARVGVVTLPAAFFTPSSEGSKEGEEVVRDRWVRFSVANVDDEKVRLVCERLAGFSPGIENNTRN